MKPSEPTETIRQEQFGRFRRLADGQKPFLHVAGTKLDGKTAARSVYAGTDKILEIDAGIGSTQNKLFDADASIRISRMTPGNEVKEVTPTREKEEHKEMAHPTKKVRTIDVWA